MISYQFADAVRNINMGKPTEACEKVERTRPLCPYPRVARYSGQGSSDDAKNFRCVAP